MSAQPSLGLVIGPGSVKCAAALGLWNVLERNGIKLDMIVGCSSGSVYAAGIALGIEVAAIEDKIRTLWVDVMAGYSCSLRTVLAGETQFTERSGLVDGDAAQERVTAFWGERTFAHTQTPLHIVATDFMNGEPVVLSQGRLADAIHASIATPVIFPPHEVDGRLLADGAMSNPLPVDVAIKEGCDTILTIGFELPYLERMGSFYAVQSHLNTVYANNILRATYAFYTLAHHAEIMPILPDFERNINSWDTGQLPYIIEQGEKAAEAQVPYLKRLLSVDRNEGS